MSSHPNSISFRKVLLLITFLASTYQASATQPSPLIQQPRFLRAEFTIPADLEATWLASATKWLHQFSTKAPDTWHSKLIAKSIVNVLPMYWKVRKMSPEKSFAFVVATSTESKSFFDSPIFNKWATFVEKTYKEDAGKEMAVAMTQHIEMSSLTVTLLKGLQSEQHQARAQTLINEIDSAMAKTSLDEIVQASKNEDIFKNADFIWWMYFRSGEYGNTTPLPQFLVDLLADTKKLEALKEHDENLYQRLMTLSGQGSEEYKFLSYSPKTIKDETATTS